MIFRSGVKKDYSQCLDVLKSAFRKYPFFEIYKAKRAEDQKQYFDTMMEMWLDSSFKYGSVLVAEENSQIAGLAVLQAPDDKEIDIVDPAHEKYPLLVNLAGAKTLDSFIDMCKASDLVCYNLPDPKWYLVLLAVSPEHAGQGIGSQILQKSVVPYISDRAGGLLTFNTSAEGNRHFYQRNGFKEFDATTLSENGIELGDWSYKMKID